MNGLGAPTNRRKRATYGSPPAPSPAAKADGLVGRGSGGQIPPSLKTENLNGFEQPLCGDTPYLHLRYEPGMSPVGDARERESSGPRRNSRSHGGAAPLPDEVRSLGYPATNSPRGKAQAGKSPLRHHEKSGSYMTSACGPSFFVNRILSKFCPRVSRTPASLSHSHCPFRLSGSRVSSFVDANLI